MLSKAIYLKAARIIALFALDRAKNPRGDSLPKGDKYSKSDIVNPPLYVTRRHPTFHRIVGSRVLQTVAFTGIAACAPCDKLVELLLTELGS